MRLRDCALLAYKNIKIYRKNTILVVISFTLVITLLVSFISYIIFGNNEFNRLLYERASECYYSTSQIFNATQYEFYPEIKSIKRFSFNGKLNDYSLVIDGNDLSFHENSEPFMVDPDEKIHGNNYYSVQIDILNKDSILFTNMDKLEYQTRYKNSKPLLYGYEPNNEKDLLISESLLKLYGIDNIFDSLLGKKITLIHNSDDVTIFENYVITGIISSEYFQMAGTYNDSQIIIINNNEDFMDSSYIDYIYKYYAPSYKEAKEMYDFAKSKGLDFDINYSVQTYEAMLAQKNIIWKILFIALVLVLIMVLLFVLVTEYYAYHKKKNILQTEIYLGMTQKDLLKLMYTENLIYLLISTIASIIIVPCLLSLLKRLVIELFSISLRFDFRITYLILIIGVAFFCIFTYLISLVFANKTLVDTHLTSQ